MTVDEKIRRAEEIYLKRQMQNEKNSYATVRVNNNKETKTYGNKAIKKMIIQLIVCFFIYMIYYFVQNSNYIFSEDLINKTKEILSYNIDFNQYYNQFTSWLNDDNQESSGGQEEADKTDGVDETESVENELNVIEINNIAFRLGTEAAYLEAKIRDANIGGANEGLDVIGEDSDYFRIDISTIDTSNLSQMEIDAIDIKNAVSMIKPLEGTITSRYGYRNPTTRECT